MINVLPNTIHLKAIVINVINNVLNVLVVELTNV